MSTLDALTWALAHSLWQLVLPAAVLALARAAAGPKHAAFRHHAAIVALAAQPALPAITFWILSSPAPSIAPEQLAAGAPALAIWVPLIWAAGVQLMLIRVVVGLARVRRIERGAAPIDQERRLRFEAIASKLGVRRPIRWLVSHAVSVPISPKRPRDIRR
jgi:D-alanyl-D-alanine endopeptidase (penicillin-binding protein 7)